MRIAEKAPDTTDWAVNVSLPHLRVVVDGEVSNRPLPRVGDLSIGRDPDADICIGHPSVSSRHALLHIGKTLTIEDVGSRNGTRVRARILRPHIPVEIVHDEAIEIAAALVCVSDEARTQRSRRICSHDEFEKQLAEQVGRDRRDLEFTVARIHIEGEITASAAQTAIAGVVRSYDLIAKYAPNEFEILLLECTKGLGDEVIRRIAQQLTTLGGRVRFGAAHYPSDALRAEHLSALTSTNRRQPNAGPQDAIVRDPLMKRVFELVGRIANSSIHVLLLGETGVGKEIVAQFLHDASPRTENRMLRLNCAAFTETLLESEMFGYEAGAFTGANKKKIGLLESASGSTVLLDEIGEMPASLQARLLRVIEENQVLPVGGVTPRPIDVRFVAATNRDLEAEVHRGAFRSDLYYRLCGFSVVIPPLRERRSEIGPLALNFAEIICRNSRRGRSEFHPDAMAALLAYNWPGNVRELRNVVERAVVLANGEPIALLHLPIEKLRSGLASEAPLDDRPGPAGGIETQMHSRQQRSRELERSETVDFVPIPGDISGCPETSSPTRTSTAGNSLRHVLACSERQHIVDALEACGQNQTRAAKYLGVSRSTLLRRLKHFGITLDKPKGKG